MAWPLTKWHQSMCVWHAPSHQKTLRHAQLRPSSVISTRAWSEWMAFASMRAARYVDEVVARSLGARGVWALAMAIAIDWRQWAESKSIIVDWNRTTHSHTHRLTNWCCCLPVGALKSSRHKGIWFCYVVNGASVWMYLYLKKNTINSQLSLVSILAIHQIADSV